MRYTRARARVRGAQYCIKHISFIDGQCIQLTREMFDSSSDKTGALAGAIVGVPMSWRRVCTGFVTERQLLRPHQRILADVVADMESPDGGGVESIACQFSSNDLCFELDRIPNQQHAQVNTNQMYKCIYNLCV